jgi:hypothetical protein
MPVRVDQARADSAPVQLDNLSGGVQISGQVPGRTDGGDRTVPAYHRVRAVQSRLVQVTGVHRLRARDGQCAHGASSCSDHTRREW